MMIKRRIKDERIIKEKKKKDNLIKIWLLV